MPAGMAVSRSLVFVLNNGVILLDWGDGRGVDLVRGEFIEFNEADYSHPVQDDELDTLRRMGWVSDFNQHTVYITSLPEPPSSGEA